MKKSKKPISATKQKSMFFAGVILMAVAIFMSSFAFSMQMILNPVNDKSTTEINLEEENQRLKQDLNLLQDQYDILEAKQKNKKSTSSKTSVGSTAKSEKNTDDYDDEN